MTRRSEIRQLQEFEPLAELQLGYVTIPVIIACKKRGVFSSLHTDTPISLTSLAETLHAHPEHLQTAFQLFDSIGWTRLVENRGYVITKNAQPADIPQELSELYDSPIETLLTNPRKQQELGRRIRALAERPQASSELNRLSEGAILVPLLLALHQTAKPGSFDPFSNVDDSLRNELLVLLAQRGWWVSNAETPSWSKQGRLLIESANLLAIAVSYRPMLAKIEDRLFRDFAHIPRRKVIKNEYYIDTRSSHLSQEIQQSLFFKNTEEQIVTLFDRLPIEQQPRYICHFGCGNGTFLSQLFQTIQTKTQRGKSSNEVPLTLVGIDSDRENRETAARTLADLPNIMISSDLNDPKQLFIEFAKAGIDQPESILYIRSLKTPNWQSFETEPVKPTGDARNSDQAELGFWATLLQSNPQGLFITAAHRIEPSLEPDTNEDGPLFFLDILSAFSGSPELNAEIFLNQAASLGLFAPNQPLLFPKNAPFRRFSFSHFKKRDYRVRPAHSDDLPDLYRLEALCWKTELGTPNERLAQRIKKYPEGQFVLESDGRILGVIYSQRIDSIEALKGHSSEDVETLHRADGPVVQLLAVNIDPAAQSKQLGDQLLEFMLQRCNALTGVHSTVGVTLCKEFHKQSSASMKHYIQKRSGQGLLRDPILRFHELHGAKIIDVMPQYRPKDFRNEGNGVLVYYDLFNRKRKNNRAREDIASKNKTDSPPSKDWNAQKASVARFVESLIRQMLEEEGESDFSEEIPLMELGLDSANLLILSEKISSKFNEDLEPAFFFQHNTCERIVFYFTNKMKPPTAPSERIQANSHPKKDKESQQTDHSNQIAIIGISCRLPGEINSLQDFWTLLKKGESAIGKMPQDRWIWPRDLDPIHEHQGIDRGGFLNDIACFDAPFFRLSPREAEAMDPQQRILLELAWAAFEDAGYSPDTLSKSKTGVFIGASGSDYRLLLEQNKAPIESHMGTGNSMAILANRISYFFDFRGPSLLIDTACSSSLVALHEAVQSIRSGTCTQALVGGINLICHPGNTISYYKAGMLSQEGLCKTFDGGADGYVRSEGGVMVMLKPLEVAIADQDRIHGVIRGSATNHGGQAGGLTVPNPEQQAELLREAWADAGVGPESIGYIETHGTGTPLGDPIEIRGLKEAFSSCTKEHLNQSNCGLSSVKSNLGHLEAAAGLAGLLKAVLSLKHEALVPTINFQTLNSQIQLDDSPFFIVDQFQNWPPTSEPESPKMAGVSSFGSGGANAHVIIEEFRQRPIVSDASSPLVEPRPFIIVLSAKNNDRLKSLALNLLSYIETLAEDGPLPSLERIAYTLQRRQAMEERAAFIVNSLSEFRDLLNNLIQGKTETEGIYKGNSRTTKEWARFFNSNLEISPLLDKWLIDGRMGQVAELWVKGVRFNWELIYQAKPQHLSLPSYPFAKEQYWHPVLCQSTRKPEKKNICHAPSDTTPAPIGQASQISSNPIQVPISLPTPTTFRKPPTPFQPETEKRALQPVNQICKAGGTAILSPLQSQQSTVTFQDRGMGVYSIRIDEPDDENRLSNQVIDSIQECFKLIQEQADAKVILVFGGDRFFLSGGAEERENLIKRKALSFTVDCPLPVIAAMKGSCLGTGWLLACLCDFMVCSREGLYQYHLQEDTWLPSQEEAALFAERFGEDSKTFLFHSSKPLTGDDLKRIGLGLPTLPADEVEAYAIDLSMTLAKSPQESLVQLKRNLSKGVSEQAQKLQINRTPRTSPPNLPTHGQIPDNPWATIGEGSNIAPTGNLKKIEFPSDVIKVEAYDNGVVLVTLCDKKNKNTFSDAFLKGVAEIFEYIRSNENFKIVVLTGYEQYFCCGGTKDGLIAIQEGSAQFTDLKIFSVALECDLPVIAAMQGHAIGAGWAMGLFCDLVIFSEESVYQAPYMQYGFTPGAGSTLAFPEKLGKDLAWEVLFSAKDFRGSELRDRGVGLKILPRAEVQAYALETAHQLALSSREDLRQSKIERCKHLRLQLKSVLAQELAMHEKTFVGNQTVGKNIQELFGKGTNNDSPESPQDRTSENMDSFASDSTLLTEIRKTLTTTLAEELYMKPEAVLEDLPFLEMGLDSITGVTWIRKINELFGLSTAATKVYSYPTIQALAKHLKDEVEQRGVFQSQQLETPPHSPPVNEGSPSQANKTIPKINIAHTAPTPSDSQEETQQSGIAVIGISGQFPGARTTTEFWENIIQGKDCITEIPPTRWSVDQYFDPNPQVAGKTNSKWMGHLEDADKFDPLFFNISPLEATAMDPQQRLFLEACWGCIEDAGYAPNTLSGSRCGVFAGCAPSDYGQQIDIQKMSAQRFMGGATSILAARISYLLNLHGPSLAIDTACSSSLVAIATGCDSLRTGNSDLVLAGGVCVMAGPGMHVMTSNAGMLSSEGRCFAFDQAANGFVPGEGVGVVMLKRLEDAERDGDSIYGVIRGWGINQDGRTNGITAPSAESQSRLEKDVFKRFNIDPAGIQLMEAHGTGTKLGDPIEIEGLTKAFESVTQKRAYCALGSVKSNIGHLLMAAGVAGLIKVLLAIKHKKLPPTLHINRLNEHIKLEDSPFYLNTTTQEWKVSEGQKRRAAINSFGFSGTNSHMVIEEPPEPIGVESHRNEAFQPPYLVVLSAKNSPCLRKSAENLVTFIQPFCSKETQATESRVCLANISFTLQLGRDPMDERLGLLVESLEDLGEKLSRFLEGDTGIEGLYRGQVRLDRQTVTPQKSDNTAVEDITPNPLQHKGAQILKRWADGESIDWEKLYGKIRPSRINLPSYPFSRESYWAYSGTDQKGNHNEWSPCPLPSDIKWDCRLRNYEGKSITVLYSNDEDKEMILTLLQNMEQAANLRRPIKVSAFNVSQDWLDQSPPKPDVIFYIAPQGTDAERISYPLDFPEKLALCRHNDSEAPLFFYGIINTSDNRSDDTLSSISAQSAKIKGYAWRWIEHNRSSKPVTRIQLLLQEWLSDDRTENSPSNFRITRYEGTNRFAQNDANPAQADKNEDSPWLLEKKWKLEIPSTNEYEPRQSNEGSILILVNNESAKIGQALFRNSSCEKIVIHNDFYTCAQTGRIKAIDTAKELQSNVFLIDLSNLYPTPREEDQDPIGQVTFYQTLIESCEKLNILSVTQGLQHFRSSEMSLAGAKFAGLIKMLSAEYPQVKAKCLDIDQSYFDSPNELSTILNYESKTELRETEICYRDGDRYVPYIDANQPKQTIEKGIGELPPISKKGVYIISGGTNGIGLEIGKHLVSKGARKLVLMGITPLPPREKWELASQAPETRPYIQNKLSELIDLDRQTDRLEIYTGSISDLDNLNLFFDRIRTDVGTIKGVIHSAGIYSDTKTPAFVKKDTEAIAKVWEPKVRGIETLHQLCKNDEPDFFISFSSLTGLIPELARGVSDYAMANAFLDFFSSFQFHQKNKTYYKSITWVDWNDTGHTSRSTQEETERLENKLNALGLRTFSREDGRKLFNKSLTFLERNWVLLSKLEVDSFNKAKPHLLFVKKEPTPARSQPRETRSEDSLHTRLENWEKQKSLGRTLSISTLTQHITLDGIRRLAPSMIHRIYLLLATENSEPHPPSQESQSAKSDLGLAEPQDQHTELVDTVTESLASVLELREVDPNVTFQNYGLDSITAVVLSGRLERLLTLDIPPQWLIKYPTANSLSSHLSTQKRIANKLD